MKRQYIALMLILSLLLSLAGCSASGAARSLDAAEDRVEEKLDTAEDSLENAVRRAVTPEPPSTPTQSATVPAESIFNPITREQAEQTALDHLGLSRNDVKRLHTEYEIDDGIGHYDVQFLSGDWEYEFEIHAETGKILSYDKDHRSD